MKNIQTCVDFPDTDSNLRTFDVGADWLTLPRKIKAGAIPFVPRANMPHPGYVGFAGIHIGLDQTCFFIESQVWF